MSGSARMPAVLEVREAADSVELVLDVPDDLVWFPGHFPGNPVLPGVVLVDWAMQFARRHLTLPGGFAGLRTVKFHQRVGPSDRLTLRLWLKSGRLNWSYRVGGGQAACAEGVIRLGDVGS